MSVANTRCAVRKGQDRNSSKEDDRIDLNRPMNQPTSARSQNFVSGSSISVFCRRETTLSRSWRNALLGDRVVGHQTVTPPSSPRHHFPNSSRNEFLQGSIETLRSVKCTKRSIRSYKNRSGATVLSLVSVLPSNLPKRSRETFCPIAPPNRTKLMQNPSRCRNAIACSRP